MPCSEGSRTPHHVRKLQAVLRHRYQVAEVDCNPGALTCPPRPSPPRGEATCPGTSVPGPFAVDHSHRLRAGPSGPRAGGARTVAGGAQGAGPGRRDRGPMATALWQEGRRAAGRGAQARGAGLEALWRAGNRTVARRPQFRDPEPRDNAREPRSGDIPTPQKASQTALRGPRSMVSARGPRPLSPGKGRNFGGLGALPRSMRGLRAPNTQCAKRLGEARLLGVTFLQLLARPRQAACQAGRTHPGCHRHACFRYVAGRSSGVPLP